MNVRLTHAPVSVILLLSFYFSSSYGVAQENSGVHMPVRLESAVERPEAVVTRTIGAIGAIKNIEYVHETYGTLPYMPTVFGEPHIVKTVASVNPADTVQGAAYRMYELQDNAIFQLGMVYDNEYALTYDEYGKQETLVAIRDNPYQRFRFIGPVHLRVKNILEEALKRNAGIEIVDTGDSLRIEVSFYNLHMAFTPERMIVAADTAGFVSRYIVDVDRHTGLPVRLTRKVPYHTFIETILYQRINFADTLAISVKETMANRGDDLAPPPVVNDSLFVRQHKGRAVADWILPEAGGDSVRFAALRTKKCIIVFNSMGWPPCVQVIPFLKQLATGTEYTLVSIDPYISRPSILQEYKAIHQLNYPVLAADAMIKQTYRTPRVPVFMLVDPPGIIREIVVGYNGAETETRVRASL